MAEPYAAPRGAGLSHKEKFRVKEWSLLQKNMKKWWPVFLLPTFAAFVIGFIIPFVQGVYLSFCKFQTINKTTFIGVSN